MDAQHLVPWHRKHPEWVAVAQILLRGEWEMPQVLERFEVLRMHSGHLAFAPVGRDIPVGMPQRPFQPVKLQGAQLILAGALDALQIRRSGIAVIRHSDQSSHYTR
jgi:hypothetical protein